MYIPYGKHNVDPGEFTRVLIIEFVKHYEINIH